MFYIQTTMYNKHFTDFPPLNSFLFMNLYFIYIFIDPEDQTQGLKQCYVTKLYS